MTGTLVNDLSVEALADGFRATLARDWDSAVIRAHAERFSLDTFRHGVAQAADELMAAPPDQPW